MEAAKGEKRQDGWQHNSACAQAGQESLIDLQPEATPVGPRLGCFWAEARSRSIMAQCSLPHRCSQVDMPGRNVAPDVQTSTIAEERSGMPAWNRETLIRQFRNIDGSTRREAERQIDAYEQTFRTHREGLPRPKSTGSDARK